MLQRPSNPPPPRADVHPDACRFCGGHDFWDLGHGPVQSLCVDGEGRHACYWDFRFAVRCVKCHATFNATASGPEKSGDHLQWRLGRGDPT